MTPSSAALANSSKRWRKSRSSLVTAAPPHGRQAPTGWAAASTSGKPPGVYRSCEPFRLVASGESGGRCGAAAPERPVPSHQVNPEPNQGQSVEAMQPGDRSDSGEAYESQAELEEPQEKEQACEYPRPSRKSCKPGQGDEGQDGEWNDEDSDHRVGRGEEVYFLYC